MRWPRRRREPALVEPAPVMSAITTDATRIVVGASGGEVVTAGVAVIQYIAEDGTLHIRGNWWGDRADIVATLVTLYEDVAG